MAHYWFVLLLITDRLTPFSWFITVAGLLAWHMPPRQVFIGCILLGIVHDVIWVEAFGWMSLGLVVVVGSTLFAKSKLGKSALWLWLATLGAYQFLYSFLLHHRLPWLLSVAQMCAAAVLWRITTRAKDTTEVYLQ